MYQVKCGHEDGHRLNLHGTGPATCYDGMGNTKVLVNAIHDVCTVHAGTARYWYAGGPEGGVLLQPDTCSEWYTHPITITGIQT